ncbi:MAG: excinuclease ABC subunit UvrA [Terriglobales bacterium]
MATESIIVRGARVHNLKNIDCEIPHNTMTVVTGVSGSGKSSLAFDTIYAEGQRRYVESLSAYARQFLERIEKPDVDLIDGISPAIAIRQKNTTRNPRSTVATATEIYDYLRLLYARIGRTFCTECGEEVKRDTVDEVAAAILELGEGTKLNVLFPLHPAPEPPRATEAGAQGRRMRKARPAGRQETPAADERRKLRLAELRKRGFLRLYQGGKVFDLATPDSLLDVDFAVPVFLLADRTTVAADSRTRLVDAIETCYRESGEVIFETAPREQEAPRVLRFAERFECKRCRLRYQDPEPRLFSFNNPHGACPRCHGFGNTIDFDLDLVIPDKRKSLASGAIDPWTKPKYRSYLQDLRRFARAHNVALDVPWEELPQDGRQLVLDGQGNFPGVRGFFAYLERKKYKLHVRVFLSRYRGYAVCPDCHGMRLRSEARQVRIAGRNICEVCSLTVAEAWGFFSGLRLSSQQRATVERVLEEVQERLKYLNEVGLEYLTLDRLSSTLSGGEAQRIQLATSLGSRLVGSLYVLDEPSIGLHSRDTSRLISILHGLRDLGNTILVVEHDPEIMKHADQILDLGPGAGEHGGNVVAAGSFQEIQKLPASLTGKYLSGELSLPMPRARRQPGAQQLKLFGACAHNLKDLDVRIPLGMLVAVTGVSGSGKSTLVHEVLYQALAAAKGQSNGLGSAKGGFSRLEGAQHVREVVLVDQSPIGRTPRSNPVTYLKAFDRIRELFASLPEARKRRFAAGHFSFNISGGRCETCQGDGTVTVEMQFLADVELICEDCAGRRYKSEVLEVRYRGKNIHEVLGLTVREALQFFSTAPRIPERLSVLEEVGLGYLRLGQSATTLSGGEAQRLKLAAHLQPHGRGAIRSTREPVASAAASAGGRPSPHVLYIFDEPTTGLHFDDISKLVSAFRRLISAGGSVLVIEHNLDVIKAADWILDLGPEGGERGGQLVGEGPPEAIAKLAGSYTGKWLARILKKQGGGKRNGRN